MRDPAISVVLGLVHSMNPWQGDPYRAAMAAAREATGKPLLLVTPGGLPEAERQTYRDMGIDVFTDTDILLEGIGALMTPPPDSAATNHPALSHPPLSRPLPSRPLTEPESLSLLAEFGVATVPTRLCATAAEAVAAAEELGYPVVLKGVAAGIAHKSDHGLVHVGVRDASALARAYAATGCEQVVVQAMVSGELEAIAGVTRAEGVGLVLIAGLGGIFTEALQDVTTIALPASREMIAARVAQSRLGRVLASPRWRHAEVAHAFVDLLDRLQHAALALGDSLQAIDINPVILGPAGAVAVDALVVPRS
jgi:acetate---CoA ligase (ADP-forming)